MDDKAQFQTRLQKRILSLIIAFLIPLNLLRGMGCDIIQGFKIAKPMALNSAKSYFSDFKPRTEWL